MGKVYEFARCNLSATAASSGGRGLYQHLLKEEKQQDAFACSFECNWNSQDLGHSRLHYLLHREIWNLGVDQTALSQWVWIVSRKISLSKDYLYISDLSDCLGMS